MSEPIWAGLATDEAYCSTYTTEGSSSGPGAEALVGSACTGGTRGTRPHLPERSPSFLFPPPALSLYCRSTCMMHGMLHASLQAIHIFCRPTGSRRSPASMFSVAPDHVGRYGVQGSPARSPTRLRTTSFSLSSLSSLSHRWL